MTSATSSILGGRGLRRPRAIGVLVAAAGIVAMTYVSTVLLRPASPSKAPASAPIALSVPGAADPAPVPGSVAHLDRGITVWAANLAAEPRDFLSATTLAVLYHERGRLTGDLADHQRALEAAQTAARIAPTEPAGRLLEAAVLYTLHDFSGAFADADALYRSDPSQLGALATRADAELELGRVGDARVDYAVLSSHSAGPAVDVRLARLASVTGQPAEALRLARSARDGALAQAASGETADVGFYQFAAGEYARLAGDAASARQGYVAALAVRDTDLGALVGLARIDAFEGRTNDAIAGLQKAAAIAPQPDTLALLGDLQAATGDATAASRQFETVRFIERLGEIASTVYDRSLIRFELDHDSASDALLAKAQASLAARPDTSGHDTVAWALYRLGRFDAASTEITAAAADGAADGRLLFHRGAIELARGDAAGGRAALQAALTLGPALDPIERAEAERLLGH
jgi:tetratricopeptide (TPR) repeat protein